jgi:hypothetical protein
MSIDRSERLSAIRAVSRRDRADRDLAREIGAREVEPVAATRCPHGRGPARTCSQCAGVRVERLPFAASGGRGMPERFLVSCRRGARHMAATARAPEKATRVSTRISDVRRSAADARWSRVPVPADHYTTSDVVRLADCNVKTVRNQMQRGTLVARRIDGRVFITRESVEQWLASRGQSLPAIDSVAGDHLRCIRSERIAPATPFHVSTEGVVPEDVSGRALAGPRESPRADTSPSEAP